MFGQSKDPLIFEDCFSNDLSLVKKNLLLDPRVCISKLSAERLISNTTKLRVPAT